MTVIDPSLACEACAATGQIALQLALGGAVGGAVVVKMAAADAMAWIRRRRSDAEGELDSALLENEDVTGSETEPT
ncbi:MAG TPA: hypothetical protein VIB47_04770 [Dehalococcoidia bacterium]|jgi:hypothetical protein